MRTSAPGSDAPGRRVTALPRPHGGFTLIELLVVVAIIAIASAGISFALRDSGANQLDREAQRLSALFESARAQSRSSGVPVVWHVVEGGFRFEGLPPGTLPDRWLSDGTTVQGTGQVVLGPEPVIGPQAVLLVSANAPQRALRIATDGLRPFVVTDSFGP
ncbi:MAG TPA: prepilin-type N-terminal cleavage/methylation domain-containing protein [Ramlibacter sp.]|jgi:general secretion pathway protein H|uniref:prepilin-type N-terminal cleavage/methylation domain-containing protein n=1 Tax=Ramlibacter sp. TaxID=1917967 RepID=UPI002D6C856F|nr:prepilin-type N-terminal cleavage/methylation domain-containing protein [Ramlibacter sp.]HZY19708.1 prepilin-type N-terminal cleavage/methylation domain-containing protein [Ramlibacter sp.]